jgi:hypothetical protein
MDNVTNAVTDTASTSVEVVKGATSDVIQFKFYKNPIFIVLSLYVILIFGTYFNMNDDTKNSYVFADKFRDEVGHIYWMDILTYPYNPAKSTSSLIYSFVTSPILWYLLLFTGIFQDFIDIKQVPHQAYFYPIMFSYLILLILFTIHMVIFNFIIDPKNTDVELRLGDQNKVDKSYNAFYRTPWILLFTLSPIYVCIVVYIIRKLSK